MDIFIPRYACAARPKGIIPPSPPSESREARRKEIHRVLRTYRGTMPPVSLPGYDERPRIILPGQPGYQETLYRIACMPAGCAMVMSAGGAPVLGTSPTTTSLKAWWTLGDGALVTTDSSAAGHNLTNNATVTTTTGKVGNAASLNGSTQYLSHADHADFKGGNGVSFSFMGWAYSTGANSGKGFFVKYGVQGDGDYEYKFYGGNNTLIRFNFQFDGNQVKALTNSTDVWNFYSWIFDFSIKTVTLQVNAGTAVTSVSTTNGDYIRASTNQLFLGHDRDNGFWTGSMDEWAFYQKALTAANITWGYQAGAGRTFADL